MRKFQFLSNKPSDSTLYFIFSILFWTFELYSENWRAINLSKSKRHFIKHQEIQKSRLDLVKIGAKCMFVFMFAKCNFGYSGMWNFIFGTGNTHIIISLLSNLLTLICKFLGHFWGRFTGKLIHQKIFGWVFQDLQIRVILVAVKFCYH